VGILRRIVSLVFVLGFCFLPVLAQEATPTEEGNIVVVESAFVRSGPSDEFLPVGALYAGDKVSPVNISEDGFWILIPYSRGHGWIQRNLVRWEDNAALDLLPVLISNITPTPLVEITRTPFIPTATPQGNYVNPETAQSVYVRAGPGRIYLRLGQLLLGETVIPVARNEDTTWIMIRFQLSPLREGFGWVAADLVTWENPESLATLPIVLETSLTPTSTFTPSVTPTATGTTSPSLTPSATLTASPTLTPSFTPSATATPEPSITPSLTVAPSATATASPTTAPSNTPTATPTASITASPTTEPSATSSPTTEPSATSSPSPEPTATLEPSATSTNTATITASPSPTSTATATLTETVVPTNTSTETPLSSETATIEEAIVVSFPTETPTDAPSNTPNPTETASPTTAPTDIFAAHGTSVAVNPTVEPTPLPLVAETAPAAGFSIPLEAIVGLIALLIVAAYIGFYMQGLSAASRYKDGFVVDTCPVCQRGHLHVEERPNRLLGIPMIRRTVRCDECRSVLRETGNRRWRYAVDRIENPVMFDRFNGREVTDADLERLLKQPPKSSSARTNPTFVDDEQGN
jgi:hypothetical protein